MCAIEAYGKQHPITGPRNVISGGNRRLTTKSPTQALASLGIHST